MSNNSLSKKGEIKRYAGAIAKRAALVVFDVVAGYCSFFLALVMRFYTNDGFILDATIFLDSFYKISPFLCLTIILVFALFGLYSRRWKYAGFYDLVRIVLANATVFALLFAVTYIFFVRMPLTFYFLGTGMLFCLTCLSRLSLAAFDYLMRKYKGVKNSSANVMIVGTGETANYVRRLLENREENSARVRCFFSYDPPVIETVINEVPVLRGIEKIETYLKNYKINQVCFAGRQIPCEVTSKITDICHTIGVETKDFSSVLEIDPYSLSFGRAMNYVAGPIKVRNGSDIKDYSSCEEARRSCSATSKIEGISAIDGIVVFDISSKIVEKNDVNEEWVKKTEADTGENISFF